MPLLNPKPSCCDTLYLLSGASGFITIVAHGCINIAEESHTHAAPTRASTCLADTMRHCNRGVFAHISCHWGEAVIPYTLKRH